MNSMDDLLDYTFIRQARCAIGFLCKSMSVAISRAFLLSSYQSEVLSYSYLSVSYMALIYTPY